MIFKIHFPSMRILCILTTSFSEILTLTVSRESLSKYFRYNANRLRKFTFIISWKKFKNVHCFKSWIKFKKTSKSRLFRNIFVNNWLKYFVLGSLNAKFCDLSCYSKEKILYIYIYIILYILWKLLCELLKTSARRLLHSSAHVTE